MNRFDTLIPQPIEMTPRHGTFAWTAESVLLTDGESEENRFAVDLWMAACADRRLPVPLRTSDVAARAGADFIIGQRDRLPITRALLASTIQPLPDYLGEEGYFLEIVPERVFLVADTAAGLFYGAQTLIALLPAEGPASLPCVRIVDSPGVPLRGFMQDFGRGQTPTLETLKRTVERMAALKLNAFFPYFEDGFHFKTHPAIGRNRDRMEPEEARELVEHARRLHVRVIPIHETVAHMEGVLDLPEYEHLREGENVRQRAIVNLAHPETLTMLEETIDELCGVFPDPIFFIATDECLDLGTGRSKAEAALIGQGGLFTGHLKRLREILLKRGRRAAISPDPIEPGFFKNFGLDNFPEEYLLRTPRDIIFAPWHYGRMESYPFGEWLRDHGIDQILWGATGHSSGLFPSVAEAAENAFTFMPFAHCLKALGGVASQWDGAPGTSVFVEYDWPLIAYFAEALWNPAPRPFDEFLPACFVALTRSQSAAKIAGVYRFLGATDAFLPWGGGFLASSSNLQFYRPIEAHELNPEQLERVLELRDKTAEARATLAAAAPAATSYRDMLVSLSFALDQIDLLADLVSARHDLAVHETLPTDTKDELIRKLESMKTFFSRLWKASYKPKALSLNLRRFHKLIASVNAAP